VLEYECLQNKANIRQLKVVIKMSERTKRKPHPTLLIISLETFQTKIFFLCAHPQVVYYNYSKFHWIGLSVKDRLTARQADSYLP